MTDLYERLLEHLLRDELAARVDPSALAARVLADLAAGRRVDVDVAAERRRRWPWLHTVAAAAAVLVVALALHLAHDDAWIAEQPLSCAGSDGAFTRNDRIAAGACVVNDTDSTVVVSTADHSRLRSAADTVFARSPEPRAIVLLAGTVELQSQCDSWQLDGLWAQVTVAPASVVRCTFESSPVFRDPLEPLMNAIDLGARLRANASVLTLTVLLGTADVVTAQGREPVAAGQTKVLPRAEQAAAATQAKELYATVRRDLPPPTDEASMVAGKQVEETMHDLMTLVLQQPAAMASIRAPLVTDLAAAGRPPETRVRLLRLALLDEDRTTFAAAAAWWPTTTDLFDFEAQLALAERGFAPAMAALREFLAEPRGVLAARATAALVLGGDATAKPSLAPFLRTTVAEGIEDFRVFDARCVAAMAMATAGDAAPLQALHAEVCAWAEAQLADGGAQQAALAASFLRRLLAGSSGKTGRVSWSPLRTNALQLPPGSDAEVARAVIRRLRP